MTARCPRCNGPMIPDFEGSACLPCGYVDYGNGRDFGETLALMAEVSRPPAMKAEDYEEGDDVLLQAIAQRLGVEVDDLRGREMRYAALRRAVGSELRALGWAYYRIALAMDKIPSTVSKWFST